MNNLPPEGNLVFSDQDSPFSFDDFVSNYEENGGLRIGPLDLYGMSAQPDWFSELPEAELTRLYNPLRNPRRSRHGKQKMAFCKQVGLLILANDLGLLTVFGGKRFLLKEINKIRDIESQIPLITSAVLLYRNNKEAFFRSWIQMGPFLNAPCHLPIFRKPTTPRRLGVGYRDKGSAPLVSTEAKKADAEYYSDLEDCDPMYLCFLVRILQDFKEKEIPEEMSLAHSRMDDIILDIKGVISDHLRTRDPSS